MIFTSKTISAVFFPFVIPIYLVFICVFANPYVAVNLSFSARLLLLVIILMNAMALPLVVVFLMNRFGFIRNLELRERNDRNAVLAVTAVFLYATFYILRELSFHLALQLVLLGCILAILFLFALSYKWKISIYMAGAGSLMGLLVSLSQFFMLDLGVFELSILLLSGLLGTSRLILEKHTAAEIYSGFLCGLISQILIFQFI